MVRNNLIATRRLTPSGILYSKFFIFVYYKDDTIYSYSDLVLIKEVILENETKVLELKV